MQAPPNPKRSPMPNPNPSHTDPYSSHLLTTQSYSSYYTHVQPQNTNPNNSSSHTEQCLSVVSYSIGHVAGYEAHHQANQRAVDSMTVSSAYYQDPSSLVAVSNWPAIGVAGQQQMPSLYLTGVATPQNGTQQLVPANPNFSTLWSAATTQPQQSVNGKRVWKKKAKIVQSAWCEICKINCNSKDVLEQHKLGKKHKKNLEKFEAAAGPALANLTMPASIESEKPLIGPQENPDKGKSSVGTKAKKAAQHAEDLETKRRKIMEGGAAANAVRICGICNVVCNSEIVFKYHLAGQKHAAMMKKHTSGAGIAAT